MIAGSSPHKFAWYEGSPDAYPALLKGKVITGAGTAGGMLEIAAEDTLIVLSEGAYPEYYPGRGRKTEKASVTAHVYGRIFFICFSAHVWQHPCFPCW